MDVVYQTCGWTQRIRDFFVDALYKSTFTYLLTQAHSEGFLVDVVYQTCGWTQADSEGPWLLIARGAWSSDTRKQQKRSR